MNSERDCDNQEWESSLTELQRTVWTLADRCQGETQALLSLLRILECLHREIREQLFEPSLPETRKELYQLLRDIEESGGWPYIERMRLKDLLEHWQLAAVTDKDTVDLAQQPPET